MAVIYPADHDKWWAPDSNSGCFRCHLEVSADEPAVYWAGPYCDVDNWSLRQEMWLLHVACAADLGTHLIGDAREALLASRKKPWARRAARAAGHALGLQESVA